MGELILELIPGWRNKKITIERKVKDFEVL